MYLFTSEILYNDKTYTINFQKRGYDIFLGIK